MFKLLRIFLLDFWSLLAIFGLDFSRILLSKREPFPSLLVGIGLRTTNLGKALGEGLGLLKTGSLSLSLSLSPLYPFHLYIPFTSLFHSLFLSLHLSYLSLPLYVSPSTFLSLYLLLSLFYLSFSLVYLIDISSLFKW